MYLLLAWVLCLALAVALWIAAPLFGQPYASRTKIVCVVLVVAVIILCGWWIYTGINYDGWVSTHPIGAS